MIEQALSEIKTREEQAKDAVRVAGEQAALARSQADQALAEQVLQAKEKGKAFMAGVMEQATIEADNQYKEIVGEARSQAEQLKAKLESVLDQEADQLLREIVNGNC